MSQTDQHYGGLWWALSMLAQHLVYRKLTTSAKKSLALTKEQSMDIINQPLGSGGNVKVDEASGVVEIAASYSLVVADFGTKVSGSVAIQEDLSALLTKLAGGVSNALLKGALMGAAALAKDLPA